MKPSDYTVTPHVGQYAVTAEGRQRATVLKTKQCSCGGTAIHPCVHIEAVTEYLKNGGKRAKSFVPEERRAVEERITECPICEAEVHWAGSSRYPNMWKCSENPAHFWQWYGEEHKVKEFFLGGRPTGIAAIDEMTTDEYDKYLNTLEEAKYGSGVETE